MHDLFWAAQRESASGDHRDALALCLASMGPRDLLRLAADARAAFTTPGIGSSRDAAHLVTGASATPSLCVLSLHRSGYVREAATRALALVDDPQVLPFLLLRLDDIVESTREAAAAALVPWSRPERAASSVAHLPVLEALSGRRRGAVGSAIRRLRDALSSGDPGCDEALARAAQDPDAEVRLAVLRMRLAPAPPEREERLLRDALADRDTRVRLWAARRAAGSHVAPQATRALLPTLARASSASVRVLALRAALRVLGDAAPARTALLDRSARVRHAARLLLRSESSSGETRGAALAVLGSHDAGKDRLLGALGALADVGVPDDGAAVAPYLRDPRASVRREAARTKARIGAP